MPQVSVIIPTYNQSRLLAAALKSVLAQDFKDLETIVVDDNSADNTPAVMAPLVGDRLRYLRLDKRLSLAQAKNLGLQASSGEHIAFLECGYCWAPEKLRLQLGVFAQNRTDLALVYTLLLGADGKIAAREKPAKTRKNLLRQFLSENILHGAASSVLVKRRCLDDVRGFDSTLWGCEDWDLWLRLSQRYEMELLDKPLTSRQPGIAPQEQEDAYACRENLLDKHRRLYELYPDSKAKSLHALGLNSLARGDKGQARKRFLQAFACGWARAPINALTSLLRALLT